MAKHAGEFLHFLTEGLSKGFASLQEQHPDEAFYVWALYTSPLYGYVAISAASEASFAEVRASHTSKSEDELRGIRWNPGDWTRTVAPDADALRGVNDYLQLWYTEGGDEEDDEDSVRAEVKDCFFQALRRLDGQGVFGTGEARASTVINVVFGDNSGAGWVADARRLNPGVAVEQMSADLGAGDLL